MTQNPDSARERNFEADVMKALNIKILDINKISRLSKVPNQKIVMKNLKDIFGHLAKIMSGTNSDANQFKGKTILIDLKIGKLCAHG